MLPVIQLNSSPLSLTNQPSGVFLLGPLQSALSQIQAIPPKLTDIVHSHYLHHPGQFFPAHQVSVLMELYWQLNYANFNVWF